MKTLLITGGTSFIAQALFPIVTSGNWNVRTTLRNRSGLSQLPQDITGVVTGDLETVPDWKPFLDGVDAVVRLAARVHVMRETEADPLAAFRSVNVAGTKRLALMAAKAGVRRFVFMSSVGVNGNVTHEQPFSEDDESHPHNNYALSKLEAEQALKEIASETGMGVVIIRSPLVYGPGNPGNFLRLLNLIDKSFPLPLASINNRRSLIYLGNLVDAIATCVNHPEASGQTYLVSDFDDVSTPELIRKVAAALGRPARLFHFPPSLMKFSGRLIGKAEEVERLIGSLVVDSSKIRRELGWQPPYTLQAGIRQTVDWYNRDRKARK